MTLDEKLKELGKGLVCLVPRKDVGGITSHEKTLCDHQVLQILAALRKCREQRNYCLKRFHQVMKSENVAAAYDADDYDAELLKILNGEEK